MEKSDEDKSELLLYGDLGLTNSPNSYYITKPQNVSLLLTRLNGSHDAIQLNFINELTKLLKQCHYNSSLLLFDNTPDLIHFKDYDLINSIVDHVFEISKQKQKPTTKKEIKKSLIYLLRILLQGGFCSRKHYEKTYETISKAMKNFQNSQSVIFTGVKLLLAMSYHKNREDPQSYYYFLNQSSIALSLPEKTLWPFHKGYSILMWIKPEVLTDSVLFRIRSSTKGFECYLISSSLFYRILPENYTKPSPDSNGIKIGQIAVGKWQLIAISHDKTTNFSKLYVTIDSEERQFVVDYPKFPESCTFNEYILFENMVGATTSTFLYSSHLPTFDVKNISTNLPHGVWDFKQFCLLPANALENRYFMITPFNVQGKIINNSFDFQGKICAQLNGISGVRADNIYLDQISNISPFFYICNMLNEKKGKKLLNMTLELGLTYLSNLQKYEPAEIRIKKESTNFVDLFGYHLLSMNPQLITADSMKLLSEMMTINPIIQKLILKMMFTTINFWINIDPFVQALYMETLKANISFDTKSYSRTVNARAIIHCMRSMEVSLQDNPCCERHAREMKTQPPVLLQKRLEQMKSILKFMIISNPENFEKDISVVLATLSMEITPCLFLTLLSLINEISEFNAGHIETLVYLKGFYTIFHSARNYPFDIKANCLIYAIFCLEELENIQKVSLKDSIMTSIKAIYEREDRKEEKEIIRSRSENFFSKSVPQSPVKRAKRRFSGEFEIPLSIAPGNVTTRKRAGSLLMEDKKQPTSRSRIYSLNEKTLSQKLPLKSIELLKKKELKIPLSMEFQYVNCLQDSEFLYSALLLWMVSPKPTSALSSNMQAVFPNILLEEKCTIFNPQVLDLILSLVFTSGNGLLLNRFLDDLRLLTEKSLENRTILLQRRKLMNWLIKIESILYQFIGKESNDQNANLLSKAFSFHLSLICEALKNSTKIHEFIKYFFILSAEKSAENYKYKTVCMKYLLWSTIKTYTNMISQAGPINSQQVIWQNAVFLVEPAFNFIIESRCDIKVVEKKQSPLASSFNKTDIELIDSLLGLVAVFWREINTLLIVNEDKPFTKQSYQMLFNKIFRDKVFAEHLKLFDLLEADPTWGNYFKKMLFVPGLKQVKKERGFLYCIVLLICLGLKSATWEDEAISLIKNTESCIKYMLGLVELSYYFGNKKTLKNAAENIQFLISYLLKEQMNPSNFQAIIQNSLALVFKILFIMIDSKQTGVIEMYKKCFLVGYGKLFVPLDKVNNFLQYSFNELKEQLQPKYIELINYGFDKMLDRLSDDSIKQINADIIKLAHDAEKSSHTKKRNTYKYAKKKEFF